MLSFDSILKSKYYILNQNILNLSLEIGKLLGKIDAAYLRKPITRLRRENRIKSIQSSLAIEGNTLSEEQISDILENKPVIGPKSDIIEVQNAIQVYDELSKWKFDQIKSYLKSHKFLMKGLIPNPGKFRTKGVGIFKGSKVAHVAPPAWNVENLINELFEYLKTSKDNYLIKSCVFHYEMEFIHPFMDGNGRMGRLWQTVILMKENPVFEFLPLEFQIKNNQEEYYKELSISDKSGECSNFIEFSLRIIKNTLENLLSTQNVNLNDSERIDYFKFNFEHTTFTRKDYLNTFKDLSTATASRDLKKGIELGKWIKEGDGRTSKYTFKLP